MAMNKARRTANLNNILTYDTLGNSTLIANLTVEGLTGAGFVKADAAGLLSVDTAAYTVVTGATNYLTKITAPNTLGQSLVYDNGTSVYINTAVGVPGYSHAFQVMANGAGGLVVSTTDVASAIGIVNSSSANKTWDISPFGNHLVINESGIATRMKFDAGGNITIGGITNSGHKLEVVGSFRTTGTNTLSALQGVGDRMVVANTNGVLTTQPIPTGSITGTGAAGQVNFWTGTNTVSGSNNLFWDNANGRLGIGTNTPNSTVQISGSTTLDALLNITNTSTAQYPIAANILFPNITSASIQAGSFYTGKALSTRNGYGFNYVHSADGSNSNRGTIAFYGVDNILNWFANGNVNVNSATDLGVRFGVVGDTILRGSGNTSATTALTVQNSDSTVILRALNNRVFEIGEATGLKFVFNPPSSQLSFLSNTSITGLNIVAANIALQYSSISLGINYFTVNNGFNEFFTKTTNHSSFVSGTTFNPTSGTATFTGFNCAPIINQTGGANGITRGLYVNPTLTAAADFRAIETSAGNVLFGSNFFWDNANSRLGIGTNAPAQPLHISGSGTGGAGRTWLRVQNTNTNGAGGIQIVNGNNRFASFQYAGSLYGENFAVFTESDYPILFSTNGVAASGGTSYISFSAGGNSNEAMRVTGTKNLLINTTTDLGQRLQVIGDTLLRGSGATSATTALTVQNSSSVNILRVLNDGQTILRGTTNNDTTNIFRIEQQNGNGRFLVNANGQTIIAGDAFTSSETFVSISRGNFNPTSGTATHTSLAITPTINQTGGSNGITRGFYVNPTLTAAADWRSIEWSNNSGWGLYGAGTANNYLGGSLGVGVSPSYRLQIAPSATYTDINTGDGLSIYNPTLSGANLFLGINGTGTSQGALIQGRSGLTSTYQIQLQPYGGNVGIGINPSHRLDVNGNIGISGTIYAGKSGDFNLLYDWQGNIGIWVGNNTSAYNQYSNNSHFFTNKSGATSYATFDSTGARVYGKVVAGTDSSTNGSIILQDSYTNGNLTNIGTSFSSGAPVIGFGVTPSTSAMDAFVSSTPITAYPRGAFVVSDSLKYFSTTSATAAVGSAVTLTKRLELFNTGNLVIGGGADNGTNRLQVGGSISATSDSVINGVTIGKGGGSGALNTAVGSLALSANTTGASNTAFGLGALAAITTGSDNVAVGTNAGRYRNGTTDNIDSSGGVYIGNASRASATATTNEIVIGAGAQGAGSNTATIGNTGIVSTILRGNVTTNGSITSSITQTATASSVSISLLGSNITSYAAGFSMVNLGYGLNAMYAQHEQRFGGNATFAHGNLNGAGLLINKLAPTAAGTVTITQQSGQLRTMSNLHLMTQFDGNNNLTVTDMSGLHIYGHYRTSGTGTLTVSNAYYGIFLADPNEFGTGATITGTNWGFYQQGTAPINAFQGSMLVGTTTTDANNRLVVSGNTRVTGNTTSAQFRLSALNTAPATSTSTGTTGEIVIDANHIYVCTATNTWKRVAIATF